MGGGRVLKGFSDSEVKRSQLVFLKLEHQVGSRFGGSANQPPRSIKIGRWSELRLVIGAELAMTLRWELVMMVYGEDVGPLDGTRVGPMFFVILFLSFIPWQHPATGWMGVKRVRERTKPIEA